MVVAARRRSLLDDEGLHRVGLRAVRRGVRTLAELRTWLRDAGDCTPRLAARLADLLPSPEAESAGPFRLLAHLADGGMGRVHLAEDAVGRLVVVKTLKPEYGSSERYAHRFTREAEITARLDHANLVRSLGHGRTARGALWLALEFVPGGDLGSLIESGAVLGEAEALLITCQVARALEHAHRMALIHRDLKPSNIFLAADGTAKLADFGLARSTVEEYSVQTVAGAAMGSPNFMSPEQIEGRRDVDIRCDLYALGCVLYFALTGSPPYVADEPAEIMRMHLREPPRDVRTVRPEISDRTAKTILKLMQKDRSRRYQEPRRLVESLEKTLRALGAEPGDALAEQTINRSMRRQPAPMVAEPTPAQALAATPTTAPRPAPENARGSVPESEPASSPEMTRADDAEMTLAVSGEGLDTLRDDGPAPQQADLSRAIGARWLHVVGGGSYPLTLMLMAQAQAVMGKLRESPIDIPLRVYPIDVFGDECRRVSRSQCRVWADPAAGKAYIEDSGSANGTVLDGRVLNPTSPWALEDGREHRLEVPRAIRLSLKALPQRTRRETSSVGQTADVGIDSLQVHDALVLRRLDNRPSLAYALVLRRITIGSVDADIACSNWSGPDLELALLGGRWVWRNLGLRSWYPVVAGEELGASGLRCSAGDYDAFR